MTEEQKKIEKLQADLADSKKENQKLSAELQDVKGEVAKPRVLPEKVAKKYAAPNGAGTYVITAPHRKVYDLTKVTLAEADVLAKDKSFPFLVSI